ncbi:tetratricopeptide repeat protein [Flavobacterium sp.]|uniref:tetratricopeptide repeat protein n=1 Tax=Flavobacterium sp. TaxID=239 RepID=UPI0038FD122B
MKNVYLILLFSFFSVSAQTNFEKGQKMMEQKKYGEAKPFLENSIKENRKDYKAIDYLGEIAIYSQNWDEAIACGKKLIIAFPKNADYWYKYGGAMGLKAKSVNKFKALGMIDDVENAFLTAAKLDSKHIEARWALVMFYTELPGIVGGSESKAQKYANELSSISKVDGYLAKGYIDSYFNRYANAEINYLKAYEIGHSKTTFNKLYDLYLNKLKDKQKAINLKEQFDEKV